MDIKAKRSGAGKFEGNPPANDDVLADFVDVFFYNLLFTVAELSEVYGCAIKASSSAPGPATLSMFCKALAKSLKLFVSGHEIGFAFNFDKSGRFTIGRSCYRTFFGGAVRFFSPLWRRLFCAENREPLLHVAV